MSAERRVVIGTFVRMTLPKMVKVFDGKKCSKCGKETKTLYCPVCGGKVESYTEESEEEMDLYTFLEEKCVDDKYEVVDCENDDNLLAVSAYTVEVDSDSEGILPFPKMMSETEIKKMVSELGGEEFVAQIICGIIPYWN